MHLARRPTAEAGSRADADAEEARHQTWEFGRDLSVHLHNTLGDFIRPYTWRDLTFLAVARGPGGFTGTRIGVVTARTLAQQLEIPLFGISTLAAVALAAMVQNDLLATQQALHRDLQGR